MRTSVFVYGVTHWVLICACVWANVCEWCEFQPECIDAINWTSFEYFVGFVLQSILFYKHTLQHRVKRCVYLVTDSHIHAISFRNDFVNYFLLLFNTTITRSSNFIYRLSLQFHTSSVYTFIYSGPFCLFHFALP